MTKRSSCRSGTQLVKKLFGPSRSLVHVKRTKTGIWEHTDSTKAPLRDFREGCQMILGHRALEVVKARGFHFSVLLGRLCRSYAVACRCGVNDENASCKPSRTFATLWQVV